MDEGITYEELSEKDYKRISKFVYENYGIKLYPNKKVLVRSRLQKRLVTLGMKSFKDYCDFALNVDNNNEADHMIDRLSTNKTDFFREADHFDYLTGTMLIQYLIESGKQQIRVWSAGCSSGEEAYTIAMVLDAQKPRIPQFDFEIYGSDISNTALKAASKAIYPINIIEPIPEQYKKKYLLRSKDKNKQQIRIASNIRKKVVLFKHNLLSEQNPFKQPLDIIFCRNTIIYFDKETQEKVIGQLISNLNPGGYLFLGHSESLINTNFTLKNVFPAVYKKA